MKNFLLINIFTIILIFQTDFLIELLKFKFKITTFFVFHILFWEFVPFLACFLSWSFLIHIADLLFHGADLCPVEACWGLGVLLEFGSSGTNFVAADDLLVRFGMPSWSQRSA